MAQAQTLQPGPHIASFVQKYPRPVRLGAMGKNNGRLIRNMLAGLVAVLSWATRRRTRSGGPTPDWFDVVDPERPWYEEQASKGHA